MTTANSKMPSEENPIDLNNIEIVSLIQELISLCGGAPSSLEAELITQMIQTSLKFMRDEHEIGQLKLVSRALKEIRYAYRIFNDYSKSRCVSIFGSARTPEAHPDYFAAKSFSQQMAKMGWMSITGAAEGIMKAGHDGLSEESAMGLSIKLPFETPLNSIIAGNPRLINFRYFFTRKLMFLSHSDAVVAFPGGVGTQDELFEVLTLIQTGKTNIVPVVLLEGENGSYWPHWEEYFDKQLLKNGWVSPEDKYLYYISKSPEDAVAHIQKFYKRYHSSRYVRDDLIIRLKSPLNDAQIDQLNKEFTSLLTLGTINHTPCYQEEDDHLNLPRIAFKHTRKKQGLVRALIDKINAFPE